MAVRNLIVSIGLFASLAALIATAWWEGGEASLAAGRQLHGLRGYAESSSGILRPMDKQVVWMGDSTMVSKPGNPAYELRVAKALGPRVDRLTRIRPGLTFYHYYVFMGDVLPREPDLIVVNANLRMFDPRVSRPLDGLTSAIALGELPRAMVLPFYEIGLTIPGVLLSRALRIDALESAYFFATGARNRVHDMHWLPIPETELVLDSQPAGYGATGAPFRAYDREVAVGDSMVEMLSATVEQAVRHGSRVLVVVSPIPWQRLAEHDLYGPDRANRRIWTLRQVVEDAGGELLDLHGLVPDAEFSDYLGHVKPSGNERIMGAVLPVVERLLATP